MHVTDRRQRCLTCAACSQVCKVAEMHRMQLWTASWQTCHVWQRSDIASAVDTSNPYCRSQPELTNLQPAAVMKSLRCHRFNIGQGSGNLHAVVSFCQHVSRIEALSHPRELHRCLTRCVLQAGKHFSSGTATTAPVASPPSWAGVYAR